MPPRLATRTLGRTRLQGTDRCCVLAVCLPAAIKSHILKGPCTDEPATPVVLGDQYVIGITGPCAWRKGDFVHIDDVPERFREVCPCPAQPNRWDVGRLGGAEHLFSAARCARALLLLRLLISVRAAAAARARCRHATLPQDYMFNGGASCPYVNTVGSGSVLMIFMVIVIAPLGLVSLWALLYYLGPKGLPCSRHSGKPAEVR